MSLVFNTLSKYVIAFLLRNNCFLISWMQSPTALILELKKIKSITVSTGNKVTGNSNFATFRNNTLFWVSVNKVHL